MSDFGLGKLDRVTASVGEGDAECRANIVAALERFGLREVRAHATLKELLAASRDADIIIFGDNIDLVPWEALRELRHNRLEANPFAIVTCLVGAGRQNDARDAIVAGADDVVSRPFNEEQFVQRLRRLVTQRAGFLATSDYVGPDRRHRDRGGAVGRVSVPNPVLEKTSGSRNAPEATRAVMRDVLQARLDSHGYRLGFLCQLAAEQPSQAARLMDAVAAVLEDAVGTAALLGDPVDALLCGTLLREAKGRDVVPQAFLAQVAGTAVRSLRANVFSTAQTEAAAQGAATYLSRPRSSFATPLAIRIPGAAPSPTPPAIELRQYGKGDVIFRQDDAVTASLIVAAGSAALYRRRNAQQMPVARARKGEVLGEGPEMATHRMTAIATEPSLMLLVPRDELTRQMGAADPRVAQYLKLLATSTASIHDLYAPRSRHVSDSVHQMIEQVAAIRDYIGSPTASAGLKTAGADVAEQLDTLTAELIAMIADHPSLDRRSRVMPDGEELAAEQAGERPAR